MLDNVAFGICCVLSGGHDHSEYFASRAKHLAGMLLIYLVRILPAYRSFVLHRDTFKFRYGVHYLDIHVLVTQEQLADRYITCALDIYSFRL